jgi:ABC-2 type transport system permease protein
MLLKMLAFEWRYFTRQPSFVVTSLIFFLLTFFATVSENVQIGGGGNVVYNGPFSIAQTLLIMGFFAMFLVVNFVASTATRNDACKMSEILYSKPINPVSYQLGRFLGAFAVVVTVFATVPLGIFLGTVLGSAAGWVDVERLGPTVISHYFTAFFYLSVPTLLVLSCVFYAIAIRFRSMMGVYLCAVALFIGYNIAVQFASEPEYRTIAALLDPFGFSAFADVTRYWTMHEKNNSAIELSGVLLQNRLLWLAVAGVVLALFGGFRRGLTLAKEKAKKGQTGSNETSLAQLNNRIDAKAGAGINMLAHLKLRTGFEIKQVIFSAPFMVLSIITCFMLIAPLIDPSGMFGTPNWPLTQTMVSLIGNSTSLLMLVILAYYSAEIVWRERNSGMGDIIDSMPVNNLTFWLSKFIAIALVFALLYGFGTVVTVVNQALNGYTNFELSQYAFRLGYINLVPLMMTVVMAFFLQVISPNKYVGMLLFMVYIIGTLVLSNFGFSHPMWQFSEAPRVPYSDINQYGHFLTAHNWFMLYWLGATLVLAALSYALWHRGPQQPLKSRIKLVPYYLGAYGKATVAAGLIIFVGCGSYIYQNTRVLHAYQEQDDYELEQANYEKAYVQHKEDNIPVITKVNIKADIFPSERKIEATADIEFTNVGDTAIEKFMVHKPRYTEQYAVELAGGSLGELDTTYSLAWFTFDKPLQPGETRNGKLSVVREHKGFRAGSEDFSVLNNGTFINNGELLPYFGYFEGYQIVDRHKRRKHGLEPLERANKLEDNRYYNESFFGKGTGFIDFEATISTSEDQFAIAPGYLTEERVENGRRIYHYKMDAPMVNFYSIMSAQLESKKEQYNGINIEIYYHKDHHMNVDRMIESVKDSIDYFNANFGPYQHKQMRIIEFPGYRSFAQSFANTVPYSEQIGFITDLRDPENIDPVYYVTAHEVAHQWWGHQVGAANVQGSAIISEALSQYSALMVMEKKYGPEKIRKFLKYELDRYLRGRTTEVLEEMPFMRSENQQYIHYRKGSVVMMSLKDRLGETRLNKALADFLAAYQYQSTPYPTTLDLMAYITRDNDDAEKAFVSNLFEHISLYDLKTTDVAVSNEQDENGLYTITMTVQAKLNRSDSKGKETEIEFEDFVDVGLFNADPEDLSKENTVIYLQKHKLKSGENTIELKVKEVPKFAGVDPFVKLIDRDSGDNIKKL